MRSVDCVWRLGGVCALLMAISGPVRAQVEIGALPLTLIRENMHDMEMTALPDGSFDIRTTGGDPYVFTAPLSSAIEPAKHILAFDCFSATGTGAMQVFLLPPLSEANSVTGPGVAHSEAMSPYGIDIRPVLARLGAAVTQLRLDFGNEPGKTLRLRNLRLRPPTAQEIDLAARRQAVKAALTARERRLLAYTSRRFPCRVTSVTVDRAGVHVNGTTGTAVGSLYLAELPIYGDPTNPAEYGARTPIRPTTAGGFMATLPRTRPDLAAQRCDSLFSRWAVVRTTPAGSIQLLSHAHYVDSVAAASPPPEERAKNKKGLGGLAPDRPLSDLDDLGVGSVTVNVLLTQLFANSPAPGRTPFVYAGHTFYSDNGAVSGLDAMLLEAARRHIVVSAILLLNQASAAPDPAYGRMAAYPDADPAGIFVMPNLTSAEGVTAYAAALEFLAGRYCRGDRRFGRIHHFILHNEVNSGWVWTNAGEMPEPLYTELYSRSMRMVHLIARQYDPHAKAFFSLEHHWTATPGDKYYKGRDMLSSMAALCRTQGDFDWAIAFHPYPQDLFNPRVWEDTEATFQFDTPKITFRNLEVLDAWVHRPEMLFRGRQLRTVHLTEQGLNSRDYSPTSLQYQAAGMAYAWAKVSFLDSIQAFDYHNWVDNRSEGGLRIGLRRFPNDAEDPLGKKPIWYLFQALGTPMEQAVVQPYLDVVGARDWSDIPYRREIH